MPAERGWTLSSREQVFPGSPSRTTWPFMELSYTRSTEFSGRNVLGELSSEPVCFLGMAGNRELELIPSIPVIPLNPSGFVLEPKPSFGYWAWLLITICFHSPKGQREEVRKEIDDPGPQRGMHRGPSFLAHCNPARSILLLWIPNSKHRSCALIMSWVCFLTDKKLLAGAKSFV